MSNIRTEHVTVMTLSAIENEVRRAWKTMCEPNLSFGKGESYPLMFISADSGDGAGQYAGQGQLEWFAAGAQDRAGVCR